MELSPKRQSLTWFWGPGSRDTQTVQVPIPTCRASWGTKGPRLGVYWDYFGITQRVHIYYHYGIRSQKTIPIMVLGAQFRPNSIIVVYMDLLVIVPQEG